jgi:hypothetical protein
VGEWLDYNEDIDQDVDVEMFYNLSNYETANSYIVNSANYGYCFDGTVKGNGDNSLVGGGSTALDPKYIDILWDDTPMITVNGVQRKALTLDSHELSLGRVLFHVQGTDDINNKELLTEGNVIIADEELKVYDLAGVLVARLQKQDSAILNGGIYIVHSKEKVQKILIRE